MIYSENFQSCWETRFWMSGSFFLHSTRIIEAQNGPRGSNYQPTDSPISDLGQFTFFLANYVLHLGLSCYTSDFCHSISLLSGMQPFTYIWTSYVCKFQVFHSLEQILGRFIATFLAVFFDDSCCADTPFKIFWLHPKVKNYSGREHICDKK